MNEANEWRIWNGADKRNIQNKVTNKFIYYNKIDIDTHATIFYVCVCVCVCVTNTTKLQKG